MLTDPSILNLLLVEDSDDDAFFFLRALDKAELGCSVNRAFNGAEAIEFLEAARTSNAQKLPSAMFLDLKMPILNGFEVLDWVRTHDFASQIRIVVLSGSDHEGDKQRAAQLGAFDYLVKPIRVAHLERVLRDLCPAKQETGVHS